VAGGVGSAISWTEVGAPFSFLTLVVIELMAFAALLLKAPVRTDEVKAVALIISQAWSRATPGGAKVGGGYLTIENNTPDRLLSGSADIAAKVQVHQMSMNNRVMSMRPADGGLVIEPARR